jgi:predicted dienelactone hydrolase
MIMKYAVLLCRVGRVMTLLFLTNLMVMTSYAASSAMSVSMGVEVIAGDEQRGPITMFYPSTSASAPLTRGPFVFNGAWHGEVAEANRRLIVLSHGSGGAPWPYAELARALVAAGYVVAMPEHEGDNYHDQHLQGPQTWKRRPVEVSAAIDAVAADARFSSHLDFAQVGVFGLSAGGHTALVTAGAQWSPERFKQHCLAHMQEDFPACVGLISTLRGNWLDDVKMSVARLVHRVRFGDATLYRHDDPRITAVVAAVPMAAPIDPASLAKPRAAIGLIEASKDAWLAPKFHIDMVRAACASCEVIAVLPEAGHGSFFSPWPDDVAQSLTPLLVNPPGFDRSTQLPAINAQIAHFFNRHLLNAQ